MSAAVRGRQGILPVPDRGIYLTEQFVYSKKKGGRGFVHIGGEQRCSQLD